ncbi:AMP-binding protein [Leptospira sp. WS39.C2]
MASLLRFADTDYFLSGRFFKDLESDHPVLVDPLWLGTKLESHFKDFPLPKTDSSNSFSLVTSGSTGVPKIVWKDWNEIQNEVDVWLQEPYTKVMFQETNQVRVHVPLCHLYGLLWGFLIPRALGLPMIMGDTQSQNKSELWITSAPHLQSIISNKTQLPKRAIVSGMKFPVPLARELRDLGGISLIEIYGSTETGGMGYRDPLRQNRFQLLNEVEVNFQKEGETSELCIKSPFVSRKYFSFSENEWVLQNLPNHSFYATGDLGEISDLGFYLLGRKDRIIKHKGKRVSLDRIESEILGLKLEGQFVCVPVFDDSGDTIGLFTNTKDPIDKIYQTLRNELPDSHLPRVIVKQNQIPKLPNGKTDYQTISNFCLEEYKRLKTLKENRNSQFKITTDTSVSDIMQSILGYVPQPNEHLVYDCGMDSILFTEMFLKIESIIEHKIPEEDKQSGYFVSLSGIEEYIKDKLYLQ